MRKAETILSIIQDRGRRGLHLEDLYRQLFNPDLYLLAYGRLYKNNGAMTKGMTDETVDGMSLRKIQRIIEDLRFERYRWTPVRRHYIDKGRGDGKKRPLGIPTWSDKLLQEVMRLLLEAYYEPQFENSSHGFRPNRGCHTALNEVRRTWTGTKWFIEGDIKGCFDNIDHTILLSIIREKIRDNRFVRLLGNLLKAGYSEQWSYKPTLSGTPQGGVLSPLLANIYLDRLDKFVVEQLLPDYNRGDRRKAHKEFSRLYARVKYLRKQGRFEQAGEVLKQCKQLPSYEPVDDDYRRLKYLRYADDFILGLIGPKAEAEGIKNKLSTFLRDSLKLELSREKTLITHATTEAARFLGYEIVNQQSPTRRRYLNGTIGLRIPIEVLEKLCNRYKQKGKAVAQLGLTCNTDFEIIAVYQARFRGCVQYYALAQNLHWLHKLQWVMSDSLLRTLATKHRTSKKKIYLRLRAKKETPEGPRSCYKVTVGREGRRPLEARFGGIPLKYKKDAVIKEFPLNITFMTRTSLEQRLLAEECEVCGSDINVEVHHIRKLKDIWGKKSKPLWAQVMIARHRKTLVLCRKCHRDLHAGKPLVRVREGTDNRRAGCCESSPSGSVGGL